MLQSAYRDFAGKEEMRGSVMMDVRAAADVQARWIRRRSGYRRWRHWA